MNPDLASIILQKKAQDILPEDMVKELERLMFKEAEEAVRQLDNTAFIGDILLYDSKYSAFSKKEDFLIARMEPKTPTLSTGFLNLDSVLSGGLRPGLYTLGAISALGKTTLALQIADNIAAKGTDVLFFSLEMGENQVMAKSISRLTYEIASRKPYNLISHASTALAAMEGTVYRKCSNTQKEILDQATEDYFSQNGISKNIYIFKGNGTTTALHIRQAIADHIKTTGRLPLVILDYLQYLTPLDTRMTDKQATDTNIRYLKAMWEEFQLPLIVISSLNRGGYNTPITMESFKESGLIEYSSDVMFGLQLKGVGSADFDANAAKEKDVREVELVILKNRMGQTGSKIEFGFHARFNHFKEIGSTATPIQKKPAKKI